MWPLIAVLLQLFSLLPHTATSISFDFPSSVSVRHRSNGCSEGDHKICVDGTASPDAGSIIQLPTPQKAAKATYGVAWAFYSEPIKLWDDTGGRQVVTNFTTEFQFNITSTDPDAGDGMTFFLFPYPFPGLFNMTGGCLGLVEHDGNTTCAPAKFNFTAIELDTFRNLWDPSSPHVGININNIKSVQTEHLVYTDGQIFGKATITYNSVAKNLSVSLDYNRGGHVDLSYATDLSQVLPKSVTVGFSGSIGNLTELNQLISWSFYSSLDDDMPKSSHIEKTLLIGVPAVTVFLLTVVGLIVWFFLRRTRQAIQDEVLQVEEEEATQALVEAFVNEGGPRRIPFQQIVDATGNFDSKRKLGAGASGTVYGGFLQDLNCDVAVKRVSNNDAQQRKGEYMAEFKVISQLRHRHLVQLLGWCNERGEFLLVYELMVNLSLDKHLFVTSAEKILPWPLRYDIALQVASALLYLHEEWKECIVHRDIKCSNIMLDGEFTAKLGDFGVARLSRHGAGLQTTLLCGTIGYLAPECFQTRKASKESDVYAFGIVILELATGRKAIETRAKEGEEHLVGWVWGLFENGVVVEAADPRLEMKFNATQMERLLVVGLWCANPDLHLRPTIRKAMAALNFKDVKIDLPIKMPVATYVNPAGSKSFSAGSSSDIITPSYGIPSAYATATESSIDEQTM